MKKEEIKLGLKVRVVKADKCNKHVKVGMIGEVQEIDHKLSLYEPRAIVLVKIKDFSKGHGPKWDNWWFSPHQLEPVEESGC